jgi:hypothetical protein
MQQLHFDLAELELERAAELVHAVMPRTAVILSGGNIERARFRQALAGETRAVG